MDDTKKDKNRKLVKIPTELGATHRLTAVIEHHGVIASSGHYTAKCWNNQTKQWYLVDDHYSKKISETRVQSENVYIIMYMNTIKNKSDS